MSTALDNIAAANQMLDYLASDGAGGTTARQSHGMPSAYQTPPRRSCTGS